MLAHPAHGDVSHTLEAPRAAGAKPEGGRELRHIDAMVVVNVT
jgi:hypothetical protein